MGTMTDLGTLKPNTAASCTTNHGHVHVRAQEVELRLKSDNFYLTPGYPRTHTLLWKFPEPNEAIVQFGINIFYLQLIHLTYITTFSHILSVAVVKLVPDVHV